MYREHGTRREYPIVLLCGILIDCLPPSLFIRNRDLEYSANLKATTLWSHNNSEIKGLNKLSQTNFYDTLY